MAVTEVILVSIQLVLRYTTKRWQGSIVVLPPYEEDREFTKYIFFIVNKHNLMAIIMTVLLYFFGFIVVWFLFLNNLHTVGATKKFPFRIRTTTVKRLPPYRDSIVA